MRILMTSLLLLIAVPAIAETTFTYQGQLQDGDGPVDDTVVMEFLLYADETATTPLATDDPRSITVSDGLFQTDLDFGQQPWGDGLWLEIVIDGGDPLAPRQRLAAAPLALGVVAGSISNAEIADGAVGSAEIAASAVGSAQIDSTEVQRRVDGVCAAGSAISTVNPDGTVLCQPMPDDYWRLGGNGVDGSQFLGTLNSEPLILGTAGVDSLRIEPSDETFNGDPTTVSIIAGSHANSVADGVRGATIAGGGVPEGFDDPDLPPDFLDFFPNRVSSNYGSIGGGIGNTAGATDSQPSLGLIAQQVRDVIPSAVSESEDTLGIRYNQVTALNTAAIIELHAALQDDRDRIAMLEAENEALKRQLAARSARESEIRAVAERNDSLEQRVLALESLLVGEARLSEQSSGEVAP